jgi:DNA-binding XRE family transcriptional regulator
MLDDITAFDAALATDEEEVPHAIVKQLIEGKSPIRVWREYRGFTQQDLAERAGITKSYLSQIEGGKRTGSTKKLAALAEELNVAIEDLLASEPQPGLPA